MKYFTTAVFMILFSNIAYSRAVIRYDISTFQTLDPPLIQIVITVPVVNQGKVITFDMPTWCPGDYQNQNFGQYVEGFHAVGPNGEMLNVIHPHSYRWDVDPGDATEIKVYYLIPNEPPGNFSQNVEITDHLIYINGPGALLYLPEYRTTETYLHVHPPAGFSVITTLHAVENATNTFCASSYDALSDAPLLISSRLKQYHFSADGARYSLVFFDHLNELNDGERWVDVFRRIAVTENRLMGGPASSVYHFLIDVGGVNGGLEHADSCRVVYFPGLTVQEYAPFIAHELFHSWNVKRIRPTALAPIHYIHPETTRSLWFVEGVTEYFAQLTVRRAGLESRGDFLHYWRDTVKKYLDNPARKLVTADESSADVWETKKSDGYGGLSYYTKGELVALCLDLAIRHATDGNSTLATVMRNMRKRYSAPLPGYTQLDIENEVNKAARANLSPLFQSLTATTDSMPLMKELGYLGLNVQFDNLENTTSAERALMRSWSGVLSNP